jgi:hypothetical protein
MDKLSYKQMWADEMSKVSELENEINRLQLLVAKYSDQQREITKMVYDNGNNMELGKKIRNMFWQEEEKEETNQMSLFNE